MADKLLICISAEQVSVAHWRGNRIADCRIFSNDESGLAAFGDFIAPNAGLPAYLMVDAVEEDYRFETLPHATGSDRADMVSRKLKQHYRNAPFVNAWPQGRDSGKRRDDRYLFSALTNPDLVAGWLLAVSNGGLPVAGLYLLPIVSAGLLDKVQFKGTNLLVVAQHSAGLRLTFFSNRQFRLSRLTRSDGARGDSRARFIADEISNTRLYLHAVRSATLDEPLTVLLLDHDDKLQEAEQIVAHDNPSLSCVRLGREAIISQIGISEQQLGLTPDVIFLQLLGFKAPPSNLASASVTVGFRRYQMRRNLFAAAGAVAVTALAWGGVNTYLMADADREAAEAARQTALQQAQYQEATRQFPAAPASAEILKKTVEVAENLKKSVPTPETMMDIISKALEASPAIALKQFGWKYGETEIEAGGTATRSSAESPASAPVAGMLRKQSGLLEGEIRPFRGDYRAAIQTINEFADRLARDPAIAEVRIVKLPLNVNPTLALSGNTLDTREQTGATAEFRLLILMKRKA
jgi:hypothetical protein